MKNWIPRAAAALLLLAPLPAGAAASEFTYDKPFPHNGTLDIHDINGKISVHNGARFSLHAVRRSEMLGGDAPDSVHIRTESRADGLTVCVRYPGDYDLPCGQSSSQHQTRVSVDFDVVLAPGSNLRATTVNGSVDATIDGAAEGSTVNGRLTLEANAIRSAQTVNGSVSVRLLRPSRDSLEAKTVNGSVTVTLPRGAGATVSASTVTGGITADGLDVVRPQYGPGAHIDSGKIGDGSLRVNLETVNGSIRFLRQ